MDMVVGTIVKYKISSNEIILLEVEAYYTKTEDDLSKALGIDFTPTKMLLFKDSSLGATENEVTPLTLEEIKYVKKEGNTFYLRKK